MSQQGTLETIAQELAKLLSPLKDDLAPSRARVLFAELGFATTQGNITSLAAPLRTTVNNTLDLVAKSQALAAEIAAEHVAGIIQKTLEVGQAAKQVISSFDGIRDAMNALGLPGITPDMISQLPENLFSYLLVRYLERMRGVSSVLAILGILNQTEKNTGPADPNKPPYTLSEFDFSRISDWLSNPRAQLAALYKWGEANFDGRQLFAKIEDILSRQGMPVIYDDGPTPTLDLVIIEGKPKLDVDPEGVVLKFKEEWNTDFSLSEDDFDLTFKVDFAPPANTELLIQPNGKITFTPPPPLVFSGKALFNLLVKKKTDPQPYILLGQAGASRLEAAEFGMSAGADFTWEPDTTGNGAAKADFLVEGLLKGGKAVIDTSGGDGFISKLLPSAGFETAFDIGFGVSSQAGFYFKGSSGLEIRLPAHLDIGPVSLQGLTLGLKFADGKFPVDIGADLKGTLGPVTVVIENMGLRTTFAFKDHNGGNFGPLDVSMGFKPPSGLGISINTGAVTGGGYLNFNPEKEEYSGNLELSIVNLISAKAIGIITTRMPDGSKGFSMLIIMTAEFNPAFQLGYGFTLNGVGGLLGMNRTVLLDPLRDAVQTGAVNSIMFPQNVIANAPRIISDLKTIFPLREGKFLIGPMAKIGWGTPSLIKMSLGLIIEIPGNIAILGKIEMILPDINAPIVKIQVLFVGTVDFDKKMLTFDAKLYESSLLGMTLEGSMAVRLKWGDNPDFILTVGGFHPAYTPPPLALPTLYRLAINILNTDRALIRVECYEAITSNTAQFGAKAQIHFDLSACTIDGHISFDALFQFNPFHFIIELSSSFELSAAGISVMSVRVKMSLEGPTPWHAKGTGKISFFFFSISANFDKTWGENRNTTLPEILVLPKLLAEVSKVDNWSTVLSNNKKILVSLRKFDAAEGPPLALHPAGELVVRQKLIPLNVQIDKVGNQKSGDIRKASISGAVSGTTELEVTPVDEHFARAQYQELTEAEKLSKPSFEKMPGGVAISAGAAKVKNGRMVRRKVAYETTIIDKEPVKPPGKKLSIPSMTLFTHFLNGNSVSQSPLSMNSQLQLQPFSDLLTVVEEGFTVVMTSNNTAFDATATFNSEAAAQNYLRDQIIKDPSLKKRVQVISNFELQEA